MTQQPAQTPPRVRIQTADFDLGAEVAALRAGDAGVGAVASFIGTVRDRNDGVGVSAMELEHYPGMTERAIEAMIDAAQAALRDPSRDRDPPRRPARAARSGGAGRGQLGASRRGLPGL